MLITLALLIGFCVNFCFALLIVRFIYYPRKPNKNYTFTFLAFNMIVFFIVSLLPSVNVTLGAGVGLFALLSVLRYRSDTMPMREMTYFFVMIGLAILNATLLEDEWILVLLVNALIVVILFGLEQGWGFHYHHEFSQRITYDRLDLLQPVKRDQLIADLQERTGLEIERVEIGRINLITNSAEIKVFYKGEGD